MRDPMRAWPLLPVHGVKTGIVWSKQLDAARLYLWCSNPVKRSSLIGAKIGPLFGGERVKLQVAHTKLSHSRAFLVRAYPLQTHEMLFDAHWHAFRVFGGVPGRGIYDNMKTAVDRVGRGKQRDINARFKAMASHYVFEPEFCNPAAGWEKGQVEKNVQDARNRMWQVMPVFKDLDELNQWLEDRCIALWAETPQPGSPWYHCRCLGSGEADVDDIATSLRRLCRTQQARVTDMFDHLRAQSLQCPRQLCQPAR